jgi:hypothetical protein
LIGQHIAETRHQHHVVERETFKTSEQFVHRQTLLVCQLPTFGN